MNLLFTCAGRRNYLLNYFRDALDDRGKIFAADASPNAPALYEADGAFIVPPVYHKSYVDSILKICLEHDIKLLIPLNDHELPVLSSNRDKFLRLNIIPLVSTSDVIDICFDKLKTFQFLTNIGLNSPKTFISLDNTLDAIKSGDIHYPLVVKPRWGTASIGITTVENETELMLTLEYTKAALMKSSIMNVSKDNIDSTILIQEKLKGSEYGLDIINDLSGNPCTVFVKRKLAMRAGETDRAITVSDEDLQKLGLRLGEKLNHIGNLDCDLFKCGSNISILELNPRFGGGYPFSHAAGANIPSAILAWTEGKQPENNWLTIKPGIQSAKCDRLVTVYKSTAYVSNENK